MGALGGLKVAPMLARSVDHLPAGARYAFEPKLDGFRALIAVDAAGRAEVSSRRGRPLTAAFPEVATAAARWIPPETVLDGELVRWTHGRVGFHGAAAAHQRRPRRVAALPRRTGASRSVRRASAPVRRRAQPAAVAPAGHSRGPVRRYPGPMLAGPGPAHHRHPHSPDLDGQPRTCRRRGIIAKALDEPYIEGWRGWWKYKRYQTTSAIVGGITGSLQRPECLILGRYTTHTGRLPHFAYVVCSVSITFTVSRR